MDELWSSFHSRHRLQPLPASSLFLLPLTAERDLRSLTNSTHECEQNKKEVEKKKDVKNRIKNKQNNKQTAEVTAKHLKINRSVRAHLIKYVCLLWACRIGMWGSSISLSICVYIFNFIFITCVSCVDSGELTDFFFVKTCKGRSGLMIEWGQGVVGLHITQRPLTKRGQSVINFLTAT